jgi:hypothetical protein
MIAGTAITRRKRYDKVVSTSTSNVRSGLCVRAIDYTEGTVEHRDFVLSKAQRQSESTLCCSRAKVANDSITLNL